MLISFCYLWYILDIQIHSKIKQTTMLILVLVISIFCNIKIIMFIYFLWINGILKTWLNKRLNHIWPLNNVFEFHISTYIQMFFNKYTPYFSLSYTSMDSTNHELKTLFLFHNRESVGEEGWLYALFYTILYAGAWTSMEFSIHGGPETNPPQILRDDYS